MLCDIIEQDPIIEKSIDSTILLKWSVPKIVSRNHEIIINSLQYFIDIEEITKIITSPHQTDARIDIQLEWSDGTFTEWITVWNNHLINLKCLQPFKMIIKIINTGNGVLQPFLISFAGLFRPPAGPLIDIPSGVAILETGTIWKVLKLEGFTFLGELGSAKAEFQFTQNRGRSWTPWIPLNQHNFNNRTVDPTRFFQLRIRISSSEPILLQDFELTGEFINITKNYLRTPKLNIRLDCATMEIDGKCCENPYNELNSQFSTSCEAEENPCATNTLWNPYNYNQPIQLYEFLAKSAMSIAGTPVEYYKVHPDRKGIDFLLNENQLYNYDKMCKIKVMPVDNQFPDPAATTFSPLNFTIGDNFIVHVMRDDFKKTFGVEKRPEEYDVLFFCERNLLFEVQHSYAFKGPLHASVYYVLQLRKYEKQGHIRAEDQSIADRLKELTHYSDQETILEPLAQIEVDKITNKDQMRTLSQPKLSRTLNSVKLIVQKVECGPIPVVAGWADMAGTKTNTPALIWDRKDGDLILGESRSYLIWAKWTLYKSSQLYNLYHNWVLGQGIRIDVLDKKLIIQINTQTYQVPLAISPNIWWQIWIDVDQITNLLKVYLYKRGSERDPQTGTATHFILFDKREEYLENFIWSHQNPQQILGCASPMLLTDYRIWNRPSDQKEHQRVLAQLDLLDSGYTLLWDNMEKETDADTLRDPNW
jgi:hypothetical protein